jgi:hypothetical protein
MNGPFEGFAVLHIHWLNHKIIPMNLDLTSEQRAFRDEVRNFIHERLRAGHPPRKQDAVRLRR